MDNFFRSRPWKVLVVTFSISAPIFLLSMFNEFFLLITMAFTLTMVLKPVVDYLEKRGFPRPAAILGLYIVIGSIFVLGFLTLYPILVNQVVTLSSTLDSEHLEAMLTKTGKSISDMFPFIKADEVTAKLNTILPALAGKAEEMVTSMITVVASFIIIPLIAFFLLNDYHRIEKAIIENVPNKYFEMSLNLVHKLEGQLSKYIRGVFLETLIVGTLYIIAYEIIGLNNSFVLGIIGGVTNIIPLAGPLIGAIPALLISLIQYGDLSMFLPIVITVLVVQQIDEILVQPNIYGKILNMHPLAIILVILIGSELMGVMGMVLAIPIFTVITVTAKETNWGLKNYRITH
jgi:putative permease